MSLSTTTLLQVALFSQSFFGEGIVLGEHITQLENDNSHILMLIVCYGTVKPSVRKQPRLAAHPLPR